jgi:hypothetical protein
MNDEEVVYIRGPSGGPSDSAVTNWRWAGIEESRNRHCNLLNPQNPACSGLGCRLKAGRGTVGMEHDTRLAVLQLETQGIALNSPSTAERRR